MAYTAENLSIYIKPALPKNAADILRIKKTVWLSTYAGKGNITSTDIRTIDFQANAGKTRKEILENDTQQYWIAVHKHLSIGYCCALNDAFHKQIKNIYVLSQYQHHGIGARLLYTMFEYLGSDEPVVVDVLAVNKQACEFFGHFGFTEVGRRSSDTFLKSSNKEVEVIRMIKRPL